MNPNLNQQTPPVPEPSKKPKVLRYYDWIMDKMIFVLFGFAIINILLDEWQRAGITLLIIIIYLETENRRLRIKFPPEIRVQMPQPHIEIRPVMPHGDHFDDVEPIKKKTKTKAVN